MARFARDPELVKTIIAGVAEMNRLHEGGQFDTNDLINWLNTNQGSALADLYDLYGDWADPEMVADQQIGIYLQNLGQIKLGETCSPRLTTRRDGTQRNGTHRAFAWEVSERTKTGLSEARERLFGPGGFFERIAKEEPIPSTPGWLERTTGMFRDDPVFAEVVRLGREAREAERPGDDEL